MAVRGGKKKSGARQALIEFALGLPGAYEDHPWGETVAKVKQLGGQVFHAEDVPTVGRFAIIVDPQGAVIAVFTPASTMQSHDIAKPGEFSWHELYTTDHEAAFEFYRQIAGWERPIYFGAAPSVRIRQLAFGR